jgi:hypothetical protein
MIDLGLAATFVCPSHGSICMPEPTVTFLLALYIALSWFCSFHPVCKNLVHGWLKKLQMAIKKKRLLLWQNGTCI